MGEEPAFAGKLKGVGGRKLRVYNIQKRDLESGIEQE